MPDGMKITVSAEEGILPAGTKLSVEEVTTQIEDAVKEKVESESEDGTTVTSVIAYDINLMLDGEKLDNSWSENGYVDVTFSGSRIEEMTDEASKVEVMAVDDNQQETLSAKTAGDVTAETMELEHITEQDVEGTAVDAVSFEAEHFTVYAVTAYAWPWNDNYTITFNRNGGYGDAPGSIEAEAGTQVELPDYDGWRYGYVFVGWSEINNANANGKYKPGQNGTIYPAGSLYDMPERNVTLYATWSLQNVDAEFYIRLDGTIPTEPQGHEASEYTSAIQIDNAIKIGTFYTDSVNGVADRLNSIPNDSQIKGVYPSYNPNTQYVLWYVIKAEDTWHVDGVLLDKAKVNLVYDPNALAGTWDNMPDGDQYDIGEIAIVSDKVPTRTGYTFTGWNTASDGSGTSYKANDQILMNETLTLYAQWSRNAGTVRYNLTMDGATWIEQPSGYTSDSAGQFWTSPDRFRYPETFIVIENVPQAEGYEFLGWFDKERTSSNVSDVPAAIREVGEAVTFIYDENSERNEYTLDALWGSLKAQDVVYTYDGQPKTIEAAETEFNGGQLDEDYIKQIEDNNLVTFGDVEYSKTENGDYSTVRPTFTDVGTYNVYCKVVATVGDNNVLLKTAASLHAC